MSNLHIPELAPDNLFQIKGVVITNTVVNVWLAIVIFLGIGFYLRKKITLRPGRAQNCLEYFLEILFGYFDQVTGDRRKTMRFLPIVGSIFFFILLSNWLGLLPGTGSITFEQNMLLRPANTDLNLTAAMAIVAVIASHIFGFITVGVFAHLNKFVQIGTFIKSLTKGPVAIFTALVELGVGLIEIISEMAKVLSLSLRLFGNIFAGEVLISVMSALVGFLVPTPFMFLELFVGLIQAAVFSMLALVYLTVHTSPIHEVEH